MNIRGAIFDLDGTLTDSMYIWQKAPVDLVRRYGGDPPEDLARDLKEMGRREAAEYLRSRFSLSTTPEELMDTLNDLVTEEYRSRVPLKPGADRLLARLADFPGDVVIVTHSRDEAYHMCGQIAVMDAGRVLAHGPTKQVFADPRTVQGGRLTGCKNIFPARKVDDHTIFVPDWGVDLHPARMVEDGLVAMGVRAHSFRPEEARNPLAVHCVGKMEEPFEWIIRMRAEGQTAGSPDLWWRVSKEIVPETMPTRLGVAPEQVLLFYE